jgi:hypothetical protein
MSVLNWVKTGMYASLLVLFGFLSYLAWTVTQTVKQLGNQTSITLSQVSTSVSRTQASITAASNSLVQVQNGLLPVENGLLATTNSLNSTLLTVNSPCGGGHPCGTLADVAKTLNTVRGTFGQIEVAANHENKNLTNLDAQEAQLFADTHLAFQGVSKATLDLDALFTDPKITTTISSVNTIASNLGQTSTDFQTKFHSVLFPPPCSGKLCFVKKAWPYIKTASELAEPAYWGSQLIQSIH